MMTLTLRRLEPKFVSGAVGSDRRERDRDRDRDRDRIKSYQKWHTPVFGLGLGHPPHV